MGLFISETKNNEFHKVVICFLCQFLHESPCDKMIFAIYTVLNFFVLLTSEVVIEIAVS